MMEQSTKLDLVVIHFVVSASNVSTPAMNYMFTVERNMNVVTSVIGVKTIHDLLSLRTTMILNDISKKIITFVLTRNVWTRSLWCLNQRWIYKHTN